MEEKTRKFLIALMLIQERQVINTWGEKETQRRLNPYNPLSYILFAIFFVVAVIAIGTVEVIKEGLNSSLFKWNK